MVALLDSFWSAGTLFSTIREEATTALVIIILLLIVMIPLAAGIVSGLTATPDKTYGPINPQMVCPHCNTTGRVRTKTLTQKKGISRGRDGRHPHRWPFTAGNGAVPKGKKNAGALHSLQ